MKQIMSCDFQDTMNLKINELLNQFKSSSLTIKEGYLANRRQIEELQTSLNSIQTKLENIASSPQPGTYY